MDKNIQNQTLTACACLCVCTCIPVCVSGMGVCFINFTLMSKRQFDSWALGERTCVCVRARTCASFWKEEECVGMRSRCVWRKCVIWCILFSPLKHASFYLSLHSSLWNNDSLTPPSVRCHKVQLITSHTRISKHTHAHTRTHQFWSPRFDSFTVFKAVQATKVQSFAKKHRWPTLNSMCQCASVVL